MNVLHDGLADTKYRPCPLLTKYVEAGWLGRKTQRGFYDYRGEVPVADALSLQTLARVWPGALQAPRDVLARTSSVSCKKRTLRLVGIVPERQGARAQPCHELARLADAAFPLVGA